ncbi:MAG: hypothetical protein IT190_04670 [Microbacteriaceae bacterium]|nr:hypothetical protein [Microbacteriaceae bacterium]
MDSESDLRDAFRLSANTATTGIDTEAVVRRARARRVPKQLAFSSVSVLAVVGIAALGITALPSLQPGKGGASDSEVMISMQEPSSGDAADSVAEKSFDSLAVPSNLCGMPTTIAGPSPTGLSLTLDFPETAPADSHDVVGTVVLTNSGTAHLNGTTALEPVITVSRDGITVWHSNPVLDSQAVLIDLGPGESQSFYARFTPVECGPQDDEREQFRVDLATLDAGRYEISAAMVFVSDAAEPGDGILVGGATTLIDLY